MRFDEIKQRLDPKCWTGKKIGNPKTKVKGGVRVNNCVPAESVAEDGRGRTEKTATGIRHHADSSRYGGTEADPELDKLDKGMVNKMDNALGVKWDRESKRYFSPIKVDEEDFNGEYDDEAGMADNNLETLRRAVDGLDDIIDAGDNLPEWCQEKIAVAKSMLVNVWDYMASEEERGATTELAEEFNLIERIIENLADRNQVDADVIWEDLESLTDDELYVFAVTQPVMEDWSKVNKRDRTDGMSQKAVNAYRREHPGSKLKTAVTTKPSKLKKGSKASKRRKSYCSRSRGQMKMHNISCAKTPDKAICKARRRWNCE